MRVALALGLFALGALGGLVLVSLSDLLGYLLAMVWGLLVFPHGAAWLWRHSRGADGAPYEVAVDPETHYWRTTDWRTTVN